MGRNHLLINFNKCSNERGSYERLKEEMSEAFRNDWSTYQRQTFVMEFVEVEAKETVRKGIKVPSAGHVLAIFLVLPTRYGRTSRFPTIFISLTGMRAICDLTCFAI